LISWVNFCYTLKTMPDFVGRSRRRHLRSSKIFLANKITKYIFFAFLGLIFLVFILFIWYGRDLPTPEKLAQLNLSQSTRILDRNGTVLYDIYSNENRTYVPLSKIPKYLQEGTISIEDKNFYTNSGYSITGYIRSVLNILLLRGLSGGSTITQQLVKNTLLTSEQSIPRKIKEFILSLEVDKLYSKNKILELYLNVAPYGGANVGVETAAEGYFGKKAEDLDLVECAILAGLPQSPSYYSPYGNYPKAYVDRATSVLRRMREDGYITTKQENDADKQLPKVTFQSKNETIKAPHFDFYVKDQLIQKFGEAAVESGGLQVKTSLDYNIQKQAEDIVKKEIAADKYLSVGNGAAMVTNPKTGEILAMVGSEDYFDTKNDGNFNAALGLRQPGSSLKPITYAVGLSKGYTASTLFMDVPINFKATDSEKDYIPVNYDGKYRGPIQMRFALANSINIPAVEMLGMVGIKNVMQQAYDMGISDWQPTDVNMKTVGYSLVLGGRDVRLIDEMEAYGVFANEGLKQPLVSILEVDDAKGNVLYKYSQPSSQRVLSQEVSFIISHILLDNSARSMEFGPYSQLVVAGHPSVAVKTGTTNDIRDNWTLGYTPSYVVGVWVGNNDNAPMSKVSSGITGAAPIWNKIMSAVLKIKGKKDEPFQKPDNVVALQIDAFAGGLPKDGQPNRSEYFIKGTEPQAVSPVYFTKDGKNYYRFTLKDPISTDGKNRWQDGVNAWIEQYHKGDDLWHPPAVDNNNNNNSNNPTETPTPQPQDQPSATLTPTESPTPTPTPES